MGMNHSYLCIPKERGNLSGHNKTRLLEKKTKRGKCNVARE